MRKIVNLPSAANARVNTRFNADDVLGNADDVLRLVTVNASAGRKEVRA